MRLVRYQDDADTRRQAIETYLPDDLSAKQRDLVVSFARLL